MMTVYFHARRVRRLEVTHSYYADGTESNPEPFSTLNIEVTEGTTTDRVTLFLSRIADLDAIIDGAKRLRAELAAAEIREAIDADLYATCENCNQPGTEDNPLAHVDASALHPEGTVHAYGCPEVPALPHHEDKHADSAPVG